MKAASAYKPAGKRSPRAMADRLRTTLHAVAGDEALRAALAAGRLTGEAQAGGAWPFALEAGGGAAREEARGRGEEEAGGEAKQTEDEQAAEREAKAGEAAEQAERERGARGRKALEEELREARSSLRVRERVARRCRGGGQRRRAGARRRPDALEAAHQAARTRRPRPRPRRRSAARLARLSRPRATRRAARGAAGLMDPRLEPLSAICLALPEAERVIHEPHAQFSVRKRTFAYFLDDHHGDGIVGLTVKAPGGQPRG